MNLEGAACTDPSAETLRLGRMGYKDRKGRRNPGKSEFRDPPAWIPLFSIRVRRLLLRAKLGPQELLLAQVESEEKGMVLYKNRQENRNS